jgi:hypothetical protein
LCKLGYAEIGGTQRILAHAITENLITSSSSGLEKVRLGAHICGMRSVRAGMPMVEVTAPDGTKSAWAAAVAPSAAVEAVKKMIPPDHVATLSNQRLPIGPQTEGMRRGEVRKVEPCARPQKS